MYVLSPTSTKPKYRLIKMEKKKKDSVPKKKKKKKEIILRFDQFESVLNVQTM